MKNYLSTNSKLKRDGIFSFGIPAYKSESGKVTCPAAGQCLLGCYARQGFYVMPSVKKAQEERLSLSMNAGAFISIISAEVKRRKIKTLRIHDSGDFYSREYLNSWISIASNNPDTVFYAYTKMIPLFKSVTLPSNFTVIYSYGGKYDDMIDQKSDKHSRVFSSESELVSAGYDNVSKFDALAFTTKFVGLIYHGHKSKAWSV